VRESSGSPKIFSVASYSTSTPVRVLVLAQARGFGQLGLACDVPFILFHDNPSAAFPREHSVSSVNTW
jgi:hypothetical protein